MTDVTRPTSRLCSDTPYSPCQRSPPTRLNAMAIVLPRSARPRLPRSRGARAPLSRFDTNVASHRSVSGGGERNRTDDLLLAKQALSQLSYTPGATLIAPGGRNGARTPRVSRPVQKKPRPCLPQRRILAPACASLGQWWAREDLNLRPHAYQARALTN
jgi:hypothetical protein